MIPCKQPMHDCGHDDGCSCCLHARVWQFRIKAMNLSTGCRGYNIGVRLIDEFLAKSKVARCSSFKETAEVVAKQGLQLFLNIQANVTKWNEDGTKCSLVRSHNAGATSSLGCLYHCGCVLPITHSHSCANTTNVPQKWVAECKQGCRRELWSLCLPAISLLPTRAPGSIRPTRTHHYCHLRRPRC